MTLSKIIVGARDSELSKKQVEELYQELKSLYPHLLFSPIFVKTYGDLNKKTSLRLLDRTDFFTREIDEMLLKGDCHIGVHSAKDLPEPLRAGLALAALTKGIDPSDSLVLREGEKLKKGSIVATSSVRREECVRNLCPDVSFVDIRGTIQERLNKLDEGRVDGVVVAEAALIRLGLTHLNRLHLPGETAPMQGRLAVIVREDDREMLSLFASLRLKNYENLKY